MSKTQTKNIESLINTAFRGDDLGVRRQAIIDLGYHKQKEIYPQLVKLLDDPSTSIQHAAVISLGRYGNPQAIDELTKPKILNSPVTNIRWAAVIAVGTLGDYRIIDHLLEILDDREWIVRNQAVTELKDLFSQ